MRTKRFVNDSAINRFLKKYYWIKPRFLVFKVIYNAVFTRNTSDRPFGSIFYNLTSCPEVEEANDATRPLPRRGGIVEEFRGDLTVGPEIKNGRSSAKNGAPERLRCGTVQKEMHELDPAVDDRSRCKFERSQYSNLSPIQF